MKNKSSSKSGVALVIVLGFLVIVSALAVAFFSSVTTELKGARTFASGVTTRQLADSAANLVMAQIRDATARENGAWASQPGMIRVFRDSSGSTPVASSKAEAFFKLYSSDKMVLQGKDMKDFVMAPETEYDKNFATKPAFYTDLNAPVVLTDPITGLKTPHFPIIDPTAMNVVQGFSYDPGKMNGAIAGGTPDDRLPMPVRWIYVLQDGTFTVPDKEEKGGVVAKWTGGAGSVAPTKANPIVGRIAFWTDDDCSKVNINTAAGFVNTSDQVPPGYHGDDYMGSYWDTPRFYTNFDYGVPYDSSYSIVAKRGMPKDNEASGGLALTQLLQGEFQRYPGHPATTSLGGIFGRYMTSHDIWAMLPRTSTESYDATLDYTATTVNPFSYGSDGGVKKIVVGESPDSSGQSRRVANNQQLLPKTKRLYASPDEMLFYADPGGPRDPKLPDTYARITNDSKLDPPINGTPSKLTPQHLDQLRFFLTASSRAPELNLFGRPRVSVWSVRSERNDETVTAATLATTRDPNVTIPAITPKYYARETPQGPGYTPDGQSGLNAYDKMMLFCCTIGPQNLTVGGVRTVEFGGTSTSTKYDPGTPLTNPGPLPYRYIFLRRNPHTSRDMETPVVLPSYPTTVQEDKYADITLPRNRFLLEVYLSMLTSQDIPGFADPTKAYKNLKAKLDSDGNKNRDALLVEIFDYIRCANLQDGTTLKYATTATTSGVKNRMFAPRGFMAPSKIEFQNPSAPYDSAPYPPQGRNGTSTSTGMGRFPTISEATLVFYYAGPTWKATKWKDGSGLPGTPVREWVLPMPEVYSYQEATIANNLGIEGVPKYRQMRAFLLLSTFNPMFGYAPLANPGNGEPKISVEITGLEQLQVSYSGQGPTTLGFPSMAPDGKPLATTIYVPSGSHWSGRNMGGYEGFMHTLLGQWRIHKVWQPSTTSLYGGPQLQTIGKCKKTFSDDLDRCFFGKESIDLASADTPFPGYSGYPSGIIPTTSALRPQYQPKQEYYPFQTSLRRSNALASRDGQGVPNYAPPFLPSISVYENDVFGHPDGVGLLIPTYWPLSPPLLLPGASALPVERFNFHGNTQPISIKIFYDTETHYGGPLATTGLSNNTRTATQRNQPVQEIQVTFPSSTGAGWPIPKGDTEDDGTGVIFSGRFENTTAPIADPFGSTPANTAANGLNWNQNANPWAKANFQIADTGVGPTPRANRNLYNYYWQYNGSFYPDCLRTGFPWPAENADKWFYEFFSRPNTGTPYYTATPKLPYSGANIAKQLDTGTPTFPGGVTAPTLPGAALNYTLPPAGQTRILKTGLEPAWSFASRVLWASKNSWDIDRPDNPSTGTPERPYNWYNYRWLNIVQPGDTVRAVQFSKPKVNSMDLTDSGDLRIAMTQEKNTDGFAPHPDYFENDVTRACGLRAGNGTRYFSEATLRNNVHKGNYNPPGGAFAQFRSADGELAQLGKGGTWYGTLVEPDSENPAGIWAGKFLQQDRAPANLPVSFTNLRAKSSRGNKGGVSGVKRSDGDKRLGDFDTGIGNHADGPYANKPDEGNVIHAWFDKINRVWYFPVPYFTYGWAYEAPGDSYTSPLRQMPSPGMIGSLPRRPASQKHWETICLTPFPAGDNHPGNDLNAGPKDHLILDLFNMPIVEPYPITEPFSTAGKINMNYRIVPFDYITRTTGLRAAMAPIRVTGVPTSDYRSYKVGNLDTNGDAKDPQERLAVNYRKLLDCNRPINSTADLNAVSNTLQGFEDFFDAAKSQGDPDLGIFKSASQICEMPLWPDGEGSIADFWSRNKMTGDNVREKPYADLYPRLTTKSNTYTVHFRVQTLRQVPRDATSNNMAYAIWEEGKDNVMGEYRGATTIERYIDPSDYRLNKWLPGTSTANTEFINPDLTAFNPSLNPTNATQPENPSRSLELIYRFRTVMNKKFAPY